MCDELHPDLSWRTSPEPRARSMAPIAMHGIGMELPVRGGEPVGSDLSRVQSKNYIPDRKRCSQLGYLHFR